MNPHSMLPRYPPRKARRSEKLINFTLRCFKRLRPFTVQIPVTSPYTLDGLHELLLVCGITKTSISSKSRELREKLPFIPSGETVLRWLKKVSLDKLVSHQQEQFQAFLNILPAPFQRARKEGMVLALDFHLDPNYTVKKSSYIYKGKQKAGTKQFFCYLTVLWINGPEPVTLGVMPIMQPLVIAEVARAMLEPWVKQENVIRVLGDGDFYCRELMNWLSAEKVHFIIRSQISNPIKRTLLKHAKQLDKSGKWLIIDHVVYKHDSIPPASVKILIWVDKRRVLTFALPVTNKLPGDVIRRLYSSRFIIETYYRMMHRFQAFSCSQHVNVRFVLVSMAIWLCNIWCYFKHPVKLIKEKSKRFLADHVYTAAVFCESLVESWFYLVIKRETGLQRR